MSYIEWVLSRGAALWRERERALKERLSCPAEKTVGTAAGRKNAAADEETDAARAENAKRAGRSAAENAARTAENAARTAEKTAGQPDGRAGADADAWEEAAECTIAAGMTARAAADLRAEDENRGGSAAVWLRQELGKDMTAAANAAAREADVFTLSQERETRETEAFSQSLERDARRYDGGFLFY